MQFQLTQKEQSLIQDALQHEKICAKKYAQYAGQTQDQELKQLFQGIQQKEEQHINTLNQLLSGQAPNLQQQSQQSKQHPGMKIPTLEQQQ